jgi:hypothetical protein
MFKSFNGYNKLVTMVNGMVTTEWVEYPMAVKVSKWICFVCLVGVVLALVGSFVPAYQEYGLVGLKYAATNITNLIFVPIALLCVMGLKLKG